jgi:hypothetical protein
VSIERSRRQDPNDGTWSDWQRVPGGRWEPIRDTNPDPLADIHPMDRAYFAEHNPAKLRELTRKAELRTLAANTSPAALAEVLAAHADARERRLEDARALGKSPDDLPLYAGRGELSELEYLNAQRIAIEHEQSRARAFGTADPALTAAPNDALVRDMERQVLLERTSAAVDRLDELEAADGGGRFELIDGRKAWVRGPVMDGDQ